VHIKGLILGLITKDVEFGMKNIGSDCLKGMGFVNWWWRILLCDKWSVI
jgi:hypothetical protein